MKLATAHPATEEVFLKAASGRNRSSTKVRPLCAHLESGAQGYPRKQSERYSEPSTTRRDLAVRGLRTHEIRSLSRWRSRGCCLDFRRPVGDARLASDFKCQDRGKGKGNFEVPNSHFPELFRARSRLYRSQILQVNTRWKALVEIYTMHSFAPFWKRIPKNEENRSLISIFSSKIAENFADFYKILQICQNFAEFRPNFNPIFWGDFPKMQHFS